MTIGLLAAVLEPAALKTRRPPPIMAVMHYRHRGLAGVWRRAERAAAPDGAWLQWILRVGLAACFIGHGAFGVITKRDWVAYFAVAGIPEQFSWPLMPIIGGFDIALGVLAILYPVRAALVWMILWTVWTALLRPLAGQGVWEFFERGGNFGVPLALLYLTGWGQSTVARIRTKVSPRRLDRLQVQRLAWILRLTTAALLIGHGGFGVFIQKQQAWTHYFGVLGIDPGTVSSASLIPLVGWFEVALGAAVLVRPAWGLLLFVFAWKLSTELLRLPAGEPIWEVVERGGSYAAPLALLVLNRWYAVEKTQFTAVAIQESADAPINPVRRAA
jgi:uncharacterized membrane protein YphA (DoxX/SURF4 family)